MQLYLTAYNQDQHKFDFAASLYQTLTVVLPGKHIIVDFQTGQVHDQLVENQPPLTTADLVARFQEHQRKQGLARSTIASYRSALVALAASIPEWPQPPTRLMPFWSGIGPRRTAKSLWPNTGRGSTPGLTGPSKEAT